MTGPNHEQELRAHSIVVSECLSAKVATERMRSRTLARPVVALRNRIAYRIWTECGDYRLFDVSREIGRRDHSAAINAILAGAAAAGRHVSRVSDLRDGGGDLDWTKLAYAMAGWREPRDLTHGQAANRAGVGRGEWRKAENGRSVSSASLLRIAAAIDFDLFAMLPDSGGKQASSTRVSCEAQREARV